MLGSAPLSGRQPTIDRRHPFGQRQHVVNDGVTDFAVEVAELGLGVAVNRDAEGRDAVEAGLAQSLARVFAGVAGVAVVVVVGASVGEDDEEARSGFLPDELGGGVADGRAEARVVLVVDAADALLDLFGVALAEILNDIKLDVAAALRR